MAFNYRRLNGGLLIVLILVIVIVGVVISKNRFNPDDFASAGLESLRQQNRVSVLRAQFVSVETRKFKILGWTVASRTLILPGGVRYEIDMGRLKQGDVTWNAATHTMRVTVPPIEVSAPEVDILRMRSFDTGNIARWVTDADATLDAQTKQAGVADLKQQASAPAFLKAARDSARTAVANNFVLPLRAAGVEAKVEVRFADEARDGSEVWDTTKSIAEVLGNRH